METMRKLRAALPAMALLSAAACSETGVNAGEQGGRAFILFTVMLVAIGLVLAYFLGKED